MNPLSNQIKIDHFYKLHKNLNHQFLSVQQIKISFRFSKLKSKGNRVDGMDLNINALERLSIHTRSPQLIHTYAINQRFSFMRETMFNAILIKVKKKEKIFHSFQPRNDLIGILKSMENLKKSFIILEQQRSIEEIIQICFCFLLLLSRRFSTEITKKQNPHLNVSQKLDRFLLLSLPAIVEDRRQQWKATGCHLHVMSPILIVLTHYMTRHLKFKKRWFCLIKCLFLERNVR